MAYYEVRPELGAQVGSNSELDRGALSVARVLIAHPNVGFLGPHSARRAAKFRTLAGTAMSRNVT